VLAQEVELKRQYEVRVTLEKDLRTQLLAARAETRRLADDLALLQQQLFAAQVELAESDVRNQRMEQRIRELERFKGGKNTP